ncbi:hypothetical protein DFR88_11170 [Metallosphaera sedula]|uniref:NADH-quinone oxidoreductase subunit D domain-containing protein n=1 Tax=Metallosphaera prunae TaxID=47304 RepID=A0A4D8RV13_METPR|nr:hypothetical protein [Metallosphaera prunae]QCO30981.1 hypothetical protein DFR88_11170 [Metallosphaera prunae]
MRVIGDIGPYCLTSDGLREGPCIKDQSEEESLGYGSFKFVYGPSAGGLLESVGFEITTYGESIEKINHLPYKGRQITLSGLTIGDALLRVERINGAFTASHSISFLQAIESALEIEVPHDVVISRMAQLELERIRNNLLVIQRVLESASFLVPSFLLLQQIEEVNRAIARSCGHRYFFGANYPGGVRCELKLPSLKISDIERTLENRIFIDRLQGNGVVKDSFSIGPVARASGFKYDARLDSDFLAYRDFDLRIPTQDQGDAFSRILVRLEEIKESLRLLQELKVKPCSFTMKIRDGEGIGRVESPSGDLAYLTRVRSGHVERAYLLAPSKVNMRLFLKSMPGNIFTDFPFNWESFGIWISELEVDLE